MAWLEYTDDEVVRFHPIFKRASNDALAREGLNEQYEWVHHIRPSGNRLVPDYVLRDRQTNRWRVAVELKRSRGSVHSTRNQLQAKGYAEHNANLYPVGASRFFALGNLETTYLFALNGGFPPSHCRVTDGIFDAGRFTDTTEATFTLALTRQLQRLVLCVLSPTAPDFDQLWPSVSNDLVTSAAALPNLIPIAEPATPEWASIREFFCHPAVDSKQLLLLHCLLAEYLRGVLRRFGHPSADRLLALRVTPPGAVSAELSNAFARLLEVDFRQIFEEDLLDWVRTAMAVSEATAVGSYIHAITRPPTDIERHARERLDSDELIDQVVTATHDGEELDDRGKVITDPELARLLARMVLSGDSGLVCDPCCGDGSLLDAAYDLHRDNGRSHTEALQLLSGVEADPLFTKLARLRLLLREPASIGPNENVDIVQADMFMEGARIHTASAILLNPPFRRYEAQSGPQVPDRVKRHFASRIEMVDGVPAISASGQQNLYTYYVEFAIKAAAAGTHLGIILDNKWYHNSYGKKLREFLLRHCTIEALIEYPFSGLFSDWTIATSVLICRKGPVPTDARVQFIRSNVELVRVDPAATGRAFSGTGDWPPEWQRRSVLQTELDFRNGWKAYFGAALSRDFRVGLSALQDLFTFRRRGSLAKEEGGMSPLAFPFSRQSFGRKRRALEGVGRPGQNQRCVALSAAENRRLVALASAIPQACRGYAVENADTLTCLELDQPQLLVQATLEPRMLRGLQIYRSKRKVPWETLHTAAVAEMMRESAVRAFMLEFRRVTGLDSTVMSDRLMWVGLREPVAGELIIPRKMRAGHKVHINPFAWQGHGRQVRISSNFVTFCGCAAVDVNTDAETASKLIAAFLLSSFGQLQFEMAGYNREGCLSLEAAHLATLSVVDPRLIRPAERQRILTALGILPFPVPMDQLAVNKPRQKALDEEIAAVICRIQEWDDSPRLADEIQGLLDEYILARH